MSSEETERIAILLQARDRDLARAVDRSNKLISKFERSAGRSMSNMSRNIDRNLASAGRSMKLFVGGAIGTILGRGIAEIGANMASTVKGIASIGDEARRSGLGVEAFQELKFVAEQTRIPVDAMIDGMKELNLRADEFVVTGKGSAADAFKRLGYGAKELARGLKDPQELMLDIIGRMEDLDKAAQIRVADEVFGGTGGERFVELLAQGEGGLRGLIDRGHDVGAVMDAEMIAKAAELDRKFSEVQARVSRLAKTIVVDLAGAIDDALTVDVDEIFGSAERAIAMLGEENYRALKDVPGTLKAQEGNARDLLAVYEDMFNVLNGMTGPDGFRLMDVADIAAAHDIASILDEIDQKRQALVDGSINAQEFGSEAGALVDELTDVVDELDAIDAARMSGVIGQIQALAGVLATAAQNAAAVRENMPAGNDSVSFDVGPGRRPNNRPASRLAPGSSPRPSMRPMDLGDIPTRGGGGGGSRLDAYQSAVEATRQEIAKLEAEAASMLVAAEYGTELGDALDYARKRAELLHDAQKAGKAITPELTAEVDALAQAYVEAGMSAEQAGDRLESLRENAARGADAVSDIFLSVLDRSRSAKEAVIDLIKEIARIRFTKLMAGSAGSGFSLLGSLLNPAAAKSTSLLSSTKAFQGVSDYAAAKSGSVIAVPQAQSASRSGGGASVVRVEGGDLVLKDDGTIATHVRVTAMAAGDAGRQAAIEDVKGALPGWNHRLKTDGVI